MLLGDIWTVVAFVFLFFVFLFLCINAIVHHHALGDVLKTLIRILLTSSSFSISEYVEDMGMWLFFIFLFCKYIAGLHLYVQKEIIVKTDRNSFGGYVPALQC